ncbi:MAG: hypothetical protein V4603_01390, partial [Pseudomonadota bacterium]
APPIQYTGCIANADKCKCLTHAGEVVDAPQTCQESAQSFGYLVNLSAESPSHSSASKPAGRDTP